MVPRAENGAGMRYGSLDNFLSVARTTLAQGPVAVIMAEDGVEATPTLFLNGTRHSNMTYADLKALIDAELAK